MFLPRILAISAPSGRLQRFQRLRAKQNMHGHLKPPLRVETWAMLWVVRAHLVDVRARDQHYDHYPIRPAGILISDAGGSS